MLGFRLFKNFRTIAAILMLGVLSLGGTYWILARAVDRLTEKQAEELAVALAPVLAQGPARADARTPALASLPDVVRLAYYDDAGNARMPANSSPRHSAAAAEAAHRHAPLSVLVRDGDVPRMDTFVPAGDGVIEIVADLARTRAVLQQAFLATSLELSFLIACSFGVPAVAYFWRTQQKQRGEERIDFLAHHDGDTGLINRATLTEALQHDIAELPPSSGAIAVHLIDIDRFKNINDSFGQETGDALIKAVAQRLEAASGRGDHVARYGGDEFVVARRGIKSPKEAEVTARALAKRLSEPFHLGRHELAITASIGVALAPHDGHDASAVLKAADTAMYRAKAEGRDTVRLYKPEMDAELQKRRKIEADLRAAMENEGFDLNFQPVYEAQGDKLLGFEVLLRLKDAEGHNIPPAVFVPIAEEIGVISRIGAWVLRRACQVAATWPEHLMVAVNLSPKQFEDGNICGVVAAALVGADLPAHRLELEITEGLLLSDSESVIAQLGQLKHLGVSIAMDDFGTGYSSLSYLWRFPFDKLKIDRSFMNVLATGDESVINILKTIVSLGRTLDLQVTAEGIETQNQADILKQLQCDQLQGYHFGKPMPETEIAGTILRSVSARPDPASAKARDAA